jgi:hypothetical protein
MTARARTAIAAFEAPRAPGRGQTIAAVAALLVGAWTLYADPLLRDRAAALARPLLGAALPADNAIKFGDVTARRTEMDGQTILYVEGSLRNASDHALKAPALRVALIGPDDRPLYTWKAKPAKAKLAAGEDSEFRTRLLSPPAAFKSIAVSVAGEK